MSNDENVIFIGIPSCEIETYGDGNKSPEILVLPDFVAC